MTLGVSPEFRGSFVDRSFVVSWTDGPDTLGKQDLLVACNIWFRSTTKSEKMRGPSRGRGSHALYQGPTLVGPPQRAEKELGFTGCGKTGALYQGTTLVVP